MKTIEEIDINGKTVILRSDMNVPLKDGLVDDDSKIVKSIPTIKYIISHNARVVILSHLGRVKSEEDKAKYSLRNVAKYLQDKMQTEVHFIEKTKDRDLQAEINSYPLGSIIMLENTRFEDIPNKLESSNNDDLSKYWASLGNVYCLDAFGSAHRAHSSTAGIGKYIPWCIGFLMKEEINNLSYLINGPQRPFTILMGGAKIDDKLKLIENLLPKCDYFLATDDPEIIKKIQNLILENKNKILLPLDATVGSTYDENYVKSRPTAQIGTNEIMYDIGIKTIEKYKIAIDRSKTIFVNGTCGKYEDSKFSNGTLQCLTNLSLSQADVYIGGGDAVSATRKLGFEDKFKYLSSGGGATLEYLGDGKLSALEYLKENGFNENSNA